MDQVLQVLYEEAERTYSVYDLANKVDLEFLFDWLLAEVAFASKVQTALLIILNDLPEPDDDEEIERFVRTAEIYRGIRHGYRRKTTPPKPEMIAQRPQTS